MMFLTLPRLHWAMMAVSVMGRKSLRAVLVECFDTGTMMAVLIVVMTTAWARVRTVRTPARLSCVGSRRVARYFFQGQLPSVHSPYSGWSKHLRWRV